MGAADVFVTVAIVTLWLGAPVWVYGTFFALTGLALIVALREG